MARKSGEPLWSLFGFIQGYNTMIMLGIIISIITVVYFWKRQKYPTDVLLNIVAIAIPTAILGSRLWDMFFNDQAWTLENFFNFRGLSIHGGVIISTFCALPYCYYRRDVIDVRITCGIIIPTILIGQSVGRWGNFFNHELFGKEVSSSSLNWMTFLKDEMYIKHDGITAYRSPIFLYESLLNLLGYILIVWVCLRKNWFKPGTTAAFYLIWYGIVRAIMNPLRLESFAYGNEIGNIPFSMLVSIFWIIIGSILFIWFQFFTKPLNNNYSNWSFKLKKFICKIKQKENYDPEKINHESRFKKLYNFYILKILNLLEKFIRKIFKNDHLKIGKTYIKVVVKKPSSFNFFKNQKTEHDQIMWLNKTRHDKLIEKKEEQKNESKK